MTDYEESKEHYLDQLQKCPGCEQEYPGVCIGSYDTLCRNCKALAKAEIKRVANEEKIVAENNLRRAAEAYAAGAEERELDRKLRELKVWELGLKAEK